MLHDKCANNFQSLLRQSNRISIVYFYFFCIAIVRCIILAGTPNFPIVHWVFCIVSVLLPGCEVLTAQSRSHCAAVPGSTRSVTPDL